VAPSLTSPSFGVGRGRPLIGLLETIDWKSIVHVLLFYAFGCGATFLVARKQGERDVLAYLVGFLVTDAVTYPNNGRAAGNSKVRQRLILFRGYLK
jgi:hypothetical protein